MRKDAGIFVVSLWIYTMVDYEIRGTYFDGRFDCCGSAAVFRNLKRSAQVTSTRLQVVQQAPLIFILTFANVRDFVSRTRRLEKI